MTEEMYNTLHRMFKERYCYNVACAYGDGVAEAVKRERISAAQAYKSCLDMLEYAHNGNEDCLHEFDYYTEMLAWIEEK